MEIHSNESLTGNIFPVKGAGQRGIFSTQTRNGLANDISCYFVFKTMGHIFCWKISDFYRFNKNSEIFWNHLFEWMKRGIEKGLHWRGIQWEESKYSYNGRFLDEYTRYLVDQSKICNRRNFGTYLINTRIPPSVRFLIPRFLNYAPKFLIPNFWTVQ